ncbi:MAG: amidohydrolase family protein [Actinomycetota bacterium]
MDWYPVISCDSHIHEPRDLYEKHLPKHLRDRGPRVISLDEGDKIVMGDALVRWVGLEVQEEFEKDQRSFKGSRYELGRRGKFAAEPRKADLAHDGVQGEVVYGFSYWMEQPDREVLLHMTRIYNDWVHEELSDTADRSIAPAMLPSWDPEASVAEAKRVREKIGARAVQIAAPYVGDIKYGYASPEYDKLWAVLVDLGLPIGTHIGSGRSSPRYRGLGATLHDFMANLIDAQDIIRDFIAAGIFDRHPALRLAATEGGIGWAPWYISAMDSMWEDNGAFFYPPLPERPSHYFARNCLITWQEDAPGIRCIDMIEDSVAWGSDYPHREGTFPNSRKKIEEQVSTLPRDLQVKLCAENAARFFGFDLKLLAAKYGPGSEHERRYSQADGGSVTTEMVTPVKGQI